MLPLLSDLTIDARTEQKRPREESAFFSKLINWPEHLEKKTLFPRLVLRSAIVVRAQQRDVRIDLNTVYENKNDAMVPTRVFVKDDGGDKKEELCFDLEISSATTAYIGSLLRAPNPRHCKVWKVGSDDMQGLGRTLVEMTTSMMSQLSRQDCRLSLNDASEFTSRNCPLVPWKMREYLAVKRGYSYYEALGYGDVEHEPVEKVKDALNGCLERNNLLFDTPLGKLRDTLAERYTKHDVRASKAAENVENTLTADQKTKWAALSIRYLLNSMEEKASEFDPRRREVEVTLSELEKGAIRDSPVAVRFFWKKQLGESQSAEAAEVSEMHAFLGALRIDLGMPYWTNMFRKTLYAREGGHTHLLINEDGNAFEEVPVAKGEFRVVGLESSPPSPVPEMMREALFRNAPTWIPERVPRRRG